MSFLPRFPWALALGCLLLGTGAAASTLSDPTLQLMGSFVTGKPSAIGGELGAALLLSPNPLPELLFGPRVSAFLARGNEQTRFDLYSGIEGTLWLVNAIGPGVAFDVAAPSTITGGEVPLHYRFVPMMSVRVKRFREEGAWALRVAIPYDTHYKWGFQAGLTLQWGEVPTIGEVPGFQ